MANLISVERASLALGTDQVLDGVSLGVGGGDRIGIVGRNGGGKTTLMRVLAGDRAVESGRVATAGGTTIGFLRQADAFAPDDTVRSIVLGDRADHEWMGVPRIRDVVAGLLGGDDAAGVGGLESEVGSKSGGERRRLALARLLVEDPDVLLLDEPTNHLDVEGVAWLARHLVEHRARPTHALVTITHDRWFLDEVATRTWEVVDGQVNGFDGGYAAYVLAKAERERMARVSAERRDNLLRKELAWLRRGAPARTSKPKFRIEAANELIADEPAPRDDVELMSFATSRLGKDVIDLHDASVDICGRPLLDRVTWHLAPGERLGIVGINGSGKSTLLRVLAGELGLSSGKRKEGVTVRIGHLTQEVRELDRLAGVRVIDAVAEVREYTMLGGKEVSASSLAKRLGFPGPRQQTRVSDLSGGERRRLQILRLLMDEPNVLLLDEPTNDLDIETLTSLEDVLDGWAGTLVVVSHDRYLLERVCDRQVALMGDGKVRELIGGVDEYLGLRASGVGGRALSAPASPSNLRVHDLPVLGSDLRQVVHSQVEIREARKVMARVEKQLSRLAQREERLHAAMAEAAADHARALELNRELREIVDEREGLELEWLEAAEITG